MRRAAVFAHFDKDNIVDEYVYYYLKALMSITQKTVFVTVSNISNNDSDRLRKLNVDVIKRANIGYDFYSYKMGIRSLELSEFDELIICNDSVFGPFYPLQNVIEKMDKEECDFWGITQSYQFKQHIQSYFICFRASVIRSECFSNFWNDLTIIDDKNQLIQAYEIGLSRRLYESGFESTALIKYRAGFVEKSICLLKLLVPKKFGWLRMLALPFRGYYWRAVLQDINITTDLWDRLVERDQMPFLKKSIFSDKLYKKNAIKKYENVIKSNYDYDTALISAYIKRLDRS